MRGRTSFSARAAAKPVVLLIVVGALVASLLVGAAPASATASAPGTPTSVTATPAAAGVAVSWAAPDSDGGSALTGYVIMPSVGDPVTVDASSTDGIVNADPGTALSVTVLAVNALGESSPSASVGPVTTAAPGGLVRAPAPKRLVDSRSGIGVAKGKLAANGQRAVQVTGKAGVPSSGVASVFVNVMALDVDANTSLRVYPDGSSAPTTSTLDARKAERIIQLVDVKVGTGGRIRVRNGAGATDLVLDVAGYTLTPAASGKSTNGLVTVTDPTEVLNTRTGVGAAKAKLAEKKYLDAMVLGKGGVPTKGVAAVFVNLTAYGPSKVTGLTVYQPGPLPVTQNLTSLPGVNRSNRVLVPVAAGGKVRIYNQLGTVDVKLDLAGWVSNGSDSKLVADSLNPQAPVRLVDTRTGTGTAKAPLTKGAEITVTAAGVAGVPNESSPTPPAAVLAFVRIYTQASTSSVSLRAAATPWTSVADVTGRAGQTMGNLVLLPLSNDGKFTVRSSPGSTAKLDVVVDIVGWIGGSVLVNPDARVLAASDAATITAVDDTSIHFSGGAGSVPGVAPGRVITSAPTANAPAGLLRRVIAVDSDGAGTVAETTTAGLDDLFRRADSQATRPLDLSGGTVGPAVRGAGPRLALGATATVPINLDFASQEGDNHFVVTGSFTLSAGIDVGFHVGFHDVDAHAVVSASWHEDLEFEATAGIALYEMGPKVLFEKQLEPFALDVLGMPVWVEPNVQIRAGGEATVQGGLSAHESKGSSGRFGFDYDGGFGGTGFSLIHDLTNADSGLGDVALKASAEAKVFIEPALGATIDEVFDAAVGLQAYGKVHADLCHVELSVGVDLAVHAKLHALSLEHEYTPVTINLLDVPLATDEYAHCEFTGQVKYRIDEFYTPPPDGGSTHFLESGWIPVTKSDAEKGEADYSRVAQSAVTCPGSGQGLVTTETHLTGLGRTGYDFAPYNGNWQESSGIHEGYPTHATTTDCGTVTESDSNGLPNQSPACWENQLGYLIDTIPVATHPKTFGAETIVAAAGGACSAGYLPYLTGTFCMSFQFTKEIDDDGDGYPNRSDPSPMVFDKLKTCQ